MKVEITLWNNLVNGLANVTVRVTNSDECKIKETFKIKHFSANSDGIGNGRHRTGSR